MSIPRLSIPSRWRWTGALMLMIVAGAALREQWWPTVEHWARSVIAARRSGTATAGHEEPVGVADPHAGHDHNGGHAHDDGNSLQLSAQAMANIGLTPELLKPIELRTFRRTITVPGIVVERPGRTRLEVSTPMSGVITHVHAVQGEAVASDTLLFELRITAEELVATQTELLKTVGNIEVEDREIERLRTVSESGAVSQRTLLERQYAKDKLEVLLKAQREALRLQGLSDLQIEDIEIKRRLLRTLQIVAPNPESHSHGELRLSQHEVIPAVYQQDRPGTAASADSKPAGSPLILQEVLVHKGETVKAGATLAVVSDMSELYVEGRAFEQDAGLLANTATQNWSVTGLFEIPGGRFDRVDELQLLYSASAVDVDSRTLRFFSRLPNQVIRESPSPNGLQYVEWKYRPGQRLQVQVPVEEWRDQIVLPVAAIAREGAEFYVFQQNGSHFDRIPVHVKYRDQLAVVIEQDGSLFPGDIVAAGGAHQMQMALKNKAGGGVDPHAGHSH